MNVREAFPTLEKPQRVKRGHLPKIGWSRPPTIDVFSNKMFEGAVDSFIRNETSRGVSNEVRRYILKRNNRYGYLCFKPLTIGLNECKSYGDLQRVADTLEQSIKWHPSLDNLIDSVLGFATSAVYRNHLQTLKGGTTPAPTPTRRARTRA